MAASIHAQDVHFSHRDAYLWQRNLSMATDYQGDWQVATLYRRQWASVSVPYTTALLHLNRKFYLPESDFQFNGGLLYIQDQSGDAKLAVNKWMLQMGSVYQYRQHQFSANLQAGYVSKQFSDSRLTFPSQYDRSIGSFNEQLASGEQFLSVSLSFFDLSWGLGWQTQLDEKWTVAAGYSLRHISQPNASFLDQEAKLPMAHGVQLMAIFEIDELNQLQPIVLDYRSQKATETIIGMEWQRKIDNSTTFLDLFYVGLYNRQGLGSNLDAFIGNAGVGFKSFKAGLSYDVNISDLELASNYRGGFELMLIYNGTLSSIKRVGQNCDRY